MKIHSTLVPALMIVLLLSQGNKALEDHNDSTYVSKKNFNPLENLILYNNGQNQTLPRPMERVKRQFYPYGDPYYYRRRPVPIPIIFGGGFSTFGRGLAFGGPRVGGFGGRGFGARGFGGRGFGGIGGRGIGGHGIGGGRGGRG